MSKFLKALKTAGKVSIGIIIWIAGKSKGGRK